MPGSTDGEADASRNQVPYHVSSLLVGAIDARGRYVGLHELERTRPACQEAIIAPWDARCLDELGAERQRSTSASMLLMPKCSGPR